MKKKNKNLCGIIGGVGPEATNYLFSLVIKFSNAKTDQQHIPLLIYNNPRIPDRTAHLVYGKESPFPELIKTAKILKSGGAKYLAIPCNTAHAYIEKLEKRTGTKFLNMIELTAQNIVKRFGKNVCIGLLATDGTLKSRIYQNEFLVISPNIHIITPEKDGQKKVMKAIYGKRGIKAGFTDDPNRDLLYKEAKKLSERGAVAILEGCTEIPLVFRESSSRLEMIDPLEILAREIIELSVK